MTNTTFNTELARTLGANARVYLMLAREARAIGNLARRDDYVRWAREAWRNARLTNVRRSF